MNTSIYQRPGNDFDSLSIADLLEARDAYHVHLTSYPHVVATAVGWYRIRSKDSWPDANGLVKNKGTYARTLANSEIRPYSWPAILVFVDDWIQVTDFGPGKKFDPNEMVPKTLFLPNGRKVPVCIVQVEKDLVTPPTPPVVFPLNNIGGGSPVLAAVQGREHVATISCLVSDGHRTFALTNRHVAGDAGEILYSVLGGRKEQIGTSSRMQLTRLPFTDVYRDFAGADLYLNLDAGLIDINDLNNWTAKVKEIGTLGPLADLPPSRLSLSLVGCRVTGYGAGSGRMDGEITALLYRYKSVGGFEYLADFLIGPRTGPGEKSTFLTHPGDSGTLWVFDPVSGKPQSGHQDAIHNYYRPFGVQWGAQNFSDGGGRSYALATSLSTILNQLDLDLVRDWNLDQTDTWGSIGHFSIAFSVAACLTNKKLKNLMQLNADIISPSRGEILTNDFKGMGDMDVVHLADVPDMFWKPRIAHQGFSRAMEGPNHFADMDQVRDEDGATLLELTKQDENIDPKIWDNFYSSVNDILSGDPITTAHRGLVPFRVWQIFDEMVRSVKAGAMDRFVCAAGVLTHYVGDACQPLHISYLHDGDPEQPQDVRHTKNGEPVTVREPLGLGVHAAYEDNMVSANRDKILKGLEKAKSVEDAELLSTGFEAAKATITMMRGVFKRLPPRDIVDFFIDNRSQGVTPKPMAALMWKEFGTDTIKCMCDGAHLLAVLWQSAWKLGNGDKTMKDIRALDHETEAMPICQDNEFCPSVSIKQIKKILDDPGW